MGTSPPRDDKALWFRKGDRTLYPSIEQARATLPIFWKHLTKDPGVEHALLKISFPTAHGGVELLWMGLTGWDAKALRGEIVNEPEDVPNIHAGQAYELTDPSAITDWSYIKGGKSYGEFTTRVMLKFADEATRKEQLEALSATPLEPGDR